MSSLLLDTNVLIYSLDRSSALHKRSVHILENTDLQLFITSKVISEYFSVCSKLKIEHSTVINFYTEIKNNTSLLLPKIESIELFEKMITKYQPKGNRVYDIEIASITAAYDIDFLASFNTNDFKNISEIKLFEL